MTTLQIFRAVAGEFSEVTDANVLTWIELTAPLISEKRFGKLYNQALAYLTAHRMKLAGEGDKSTGTVDDGLRVASYSEGGVSISYSTSGQNAMQADGEYALTVYGLQYLEIRRRVIIPIISAGEIF
ncbi:MAG: DUF4054 domain-containing protein [Clostridia bacterium]|nr:DUF4054 domain-containing protein [Clostridia bacterium]